MDADTIAEGRRMEEAAKAAADACLTVNSLGNRAAAYMANVLRDEWLRTHRCELLAAAEQLEAIVGLLQRTDVSDSEILKMIREVVE